MAWRKLTVEDLLARMTEAELSAVSGVLDATLTTVTDMVRGYVASAGVEMDTEADTLPERLIGSAASVVLVDAYISLGGTLTDRNGHRKDAKENAIKLFEDVARGKFSVEDPETGTESLSKAGVTIVNSKTPRVSRSNLKGM